MKLIHAHTTANIANTKPNSPAPVVPLGDQVGELVAGDAEGDDEGEVEQQLERRRHTVLVGRVAARHDAHAVRDRPCHPAATRALNSVIISSHTPR